MANQIVTVAVSTQIAPTPATLQQTGAIVSQGGTTITPGTFELLTQPSDLTNLLTGIAALSNLTWASAVGTATTTSPHGLPNGEQIEVTISGAAPTGYNGTYTATVTGASSFT